MDEKDALERMTMEAEHWKRLALEAVEKACFECDQVFTKECDKCRMKKIMEEAEHV